ncbi:MAG: response regulator [Candidatus Marinimicrobia bacterium]|jgi:two-component system, OmpR family, response regulator|nr:response regulator [Candidatus Neomarinimicrobiota bacterium]MBT5636652.1 response regulator [Gammaproteobacteria bacterium]MBT6079129.1 response regulator [Gammaproteobacteria bacterium]MBT7828650.1 response regulator [Candidatus Neomarinimicrobiota bacterium]
MQSKPSSLLVVDDDPEIRRLLKEYLQKSEFRVEVAADGVQMFAALDQRPFDLIVLDLMMPGEDGLSLLRRLRVDSNIPVVMLTAMGEETDRILGLEMGADDYLPKPFSPRELLARIKSVLRRVTTLPDTSDHSGSLQAHFLGWSLDLQQRHLISEDDVVIPLSGGEFRLLHVFVEHSGRVLSRDQLLEFTQGRESNPFDRSVDVLVGRLRKRLMEEPKNPQILHTVRGEGYLFSADVEFSG